MYKREYMESSTQNNDNNRDIIIQKLQYLATEVLKLKNFFRQRRPIVIEFSGSPKAGKTSCINSLELFLKRNGFTVKIVQERASVCPVSDKQSPMFNLWTGSMSLAGMIGTLEDNRQQIDVLILDRGIFDVLCWFEWLVKTCKMELRQQDIAEKFFLMDEIVKSIDIVFVFSANPKVSIEREYAHLLTNKTGSIMNEAVLKEYLDAIEASTRKYKSFFHNICQIDTSKKSQDDVGKEVTETTLNCIRDLLTERVGYITKTEKLTKILFDTKRDSNIFSHEEIGIYLKNLEFDYRGNVESSTKLIQPIPIAVISNQSKDKVLIVKKQDKAVSPDSPEKDRILPYVGGHTRYEDQTEASSKDFLSICMTTLKRELKEEIGISVAVENIEPIYIYISNNKRSQNHLAVCFFITIDDNVVNLRLNSEELVINKGKTNSGNFVDIKCIQTDKLESWGKEIMKYFFDIKIPLNNDDQLMLFF